MSPLNRLIEKLTGHPHETRDSSVVHEAAMELKESTEQLSITQRRFAFLDAPDPLTALSIYIQATMKK